MRAVALCLFAAFCFAAGVNAKALATLSWNDLKTGAPVTGSLRQTGSGYPACDPSVVQRSGYFDIDAASDKHYFYWMFEAKQNPSTAPMLLWMTGGPGCSSELAVLAENGPCHMNENTGELYSNKYSWNNVANVIYIDQPAGVGFSYSNSNGYDTNETQVGNDMYKFVQAFLAAYPQYQKNDFFVYGESYGGHFAPATAHRIWEGNNNKDGIAVNLKGLSVGNGMTQPVIQLQWYAHLAYEWCITVKGAPCISKAAYEAALQQLPQCVSMIQQCNAQANNATGCGQAMDFCLSSQLGAYENTGLNVYDIRKPCIGQLCYPFTKTTAFMNRADVQQSLGVASQGITWAPCSMQVNGMFNRDWMRNFDQDVADLLNANIRVLIYSGDVDFICNWLGNKAWTLQLPWNGAAGYQAAHDFPWWLNQVSAGRVRTVSGSNVNLLFTFLQIHDAGHMVPMDQPERALSMVEHFLFDQPFYQFDGPF